MNYPKFSLALVCVLSTKLTYANVNNDEKLVNEVITTANKYEQPLAETLATAYRISAHDIQRLQPDDLPSLLNRVSGLNVQNNGGRGSVTGLFMRGAKSAQVVVLIDGVRTSSATTGATALENIPVESIESIEIVKGPVSGLYGADAVGGVIQIFTHKGSTKGIDGSAFTAFGSNQLRENGLSVSGGDGKNRFYASVSVENARGIDRTAIETDGNHDRDGFKEKSSSLSATLTLSDSVSAQLNHLSSDGRTEFDNLFGVDDGWYSESELESFGARLSYKAADKLSFHFDSGYLSDHLVTPAYFSDLKTRRRSFAIQSDYTLSNNTILSGGVDYYDDTVTANTSYVETERDNLGVFLQLQKDISRLSSVINVRHDDNEAYGEITNGSVAFSIDVMKEIKIVASYGTAFRAPTFNDLYYPGFENPLLKPEKSDSYELSVRGVLSSGSWRINFYRNEVEDLIQWDGVQMKAVNTDSATLEGIELESNLSFMEWQLVASAAYQEARDDSTNDLLDDRAVVSGDLSLGREFSSIYVAVDVQAERGRRDEGGMRLPGFGIWGFSAVYQLSDQLKLSGRVDNLFDKNYVINLATPGVAYNTDGTAAKLKIEYSFN